ncbi:hypothetical protein BDZ45DRAFT_744332 [Acephala macrosclerotiorum]|nr:hypothetical protein BDZ45DRAFT_744332 [Acephala macrosclerotiorum]
MNTLSVSLLAVFVQQALALDCTIAGDAVIERNCEWDCCTAKTTIQPGDTEPKLPTSTLTSSSSSVATLKSPQTPPASTLTTSSHSRTGNNKHGKHQLHAFEANHYPLGPSYFIFL